MNRADLEALANAFDTIYDALGASRHAGKADGIRRDLLPLFDRYALPIGARVRLLRTPEITWAKSWGWMRAKHYLVEGAIATVETVDLWEGKFNYGLIFDGASYINEMTKEIVPLEGERRGIYIFGESWVERVPLAKAVAEPANIAAEVAS